MAILLSGASAHMFMKTPVPFGHDANGDPLRKAPYILPNELNSSPLGTDSKSGTVQHFPCQFGPDFKYSLDGAPKVAAGSSTLLTFQGSAVHGGGSCQVSLAKTASKNPKNWHVIHSIVGGCPGTNAPGAGQSAAGAGGMDNFKPGPNANKPDSSQCTGTDTDELTCLKKFNIPIPKNVASGQYFLAWTWFNKVGNREMYMNCAPIEVTGGGSSPNWLDQQPSIFYANHLEGNTCTTLEGKSLNFTQPGDSVIYSQNPFDSIEVSPQGIGAACSALYPAQSSQPAHVAFFSPAAGGSGTTPAASTGSLLTATSIVGKTSVTPNAPVSAAPTSAAVSPGVFAPGASSAPAGTVVSSAPAAPISAPAAPVASSNPSIPAASCAHLCTEDGKLNCLPSNQWGICDHGCIVPQNLAAGTVCQNGGIVPGSTAGKRAIKEKSRVMRPRRAPLRKLQWFA
ncbi:spore coat protein SP96 precursor [Venturia nashicola]|uniref:Spore coat protein SP96 n=1 Tax=Venturia nashicola TaxID=86259 RepID=A0A4Z1PNX6_9PEZI|nr:spore coat protein SP96 precursor [Venturia nashicola]